MRHPSEIGHRRAVGRGIQDRLDRRRVAEADLHYARYVRPLGARGLHVVRSECSQLERVIGSTLSGQTFAPGTIVPIGSSSGTPGQSIIGGPPPGRRGASGFPSSSRSGTLDLIVVTSISPSEWEQGDSGTLTINGGGFRQSPPDTFLAVTYDDATESVIADPFVTLTSPTWVSSTEVTVTITISSTAPIGHPIGIRVTRA